MTTNEILTAILTVVTIIALIFGPVLAVIVSDRRSKKEEVARRKMHVFRTLMATRTTNLYYNHIEALNLVEIEYFEDKDVMDYWRQYRNHLDNKEYSDRDYPAWNGERQNKLNDMLYKMSLALGYSFDKSHIEKGVYYPVGYSEIESQQREIRSLLLELLSGKRQLPMKAEVYTNQPPAPKPSEQPANVSQPPAKA
jgi:hypothetical protein